MTLQAAWSAAAVLQDREREYFYGGEAPGLWSLPSGSVVKNLPAVQETQVQPLGWEDPLEKKIATHSSILAWRIAWTEEPGGLQSMGLQKEVDMTEQFNNNNAVCGALLWQPQGPNALVLGLPTPPPLPLPPWGPVLGNEVTAVTSQAKLLLVECPSY